jgi:uncharacterized membrane protein
MSTLALEQLRTEQIAKPVKPKRITSIDLLRGAVMIIMALDHTRDYFHYDAFLYSPTDLSQTSIILFFTRWITHFCAPVFVFLAGLSAYLNGVKRNRKKLSFFLLTRGIFLVLVELFVISLERTFNPSYPFFNLQVIFAIGASMIALSGLIWFNQELILIISILLIAGHNLLDNVHVPGSFVYSLLHERGDFVFGRFHVSVHYPLLPWIGIIGLGYCFGKLYQPGYDADKRKSLLLFWGAFMLVLFIMLRSGNFYGDADHWSDQKNIIFTLLSFINVTKYPPSLLYTLLMLGPALIFLALSEHSLNKWSEKITLFGRVPMFYYLAHILLLHLIALPAAVISGHKMSDMILTHRINDTAALKGYGFNLIAVYLIWIAVVLILYPFCKWFDRYKRANVGTQRWLSYL